MQLFGEKLRRAPIKLKVDATLIVSVWILQVKGEPSAGGKLVPGLRIGIGVAAAGIDCSVPKAQIGQSRRVISADGDDMSPSGPEHPSSMSGSAPERTEA